ncbi:hypothetical protein [Aeromonas veronii]|uniref:hypothetical protein n=2 Tax=Aeromonas TaxID=642 RepID=UPI003672629E
MKFKLLIGSVFVLGALQFWNLHLLEQQAEQVDNRLDVLEANFVDTNQKAHIAFELSALNKQQEQDIRAMMLMNPEGINNKGF